MGKLSLLIVFVLFATVHAAKFPSNWKKCPKKDNEECLKEAIEHAVKDMQNGKKEVNVIPLDPLHFERMELSQGGASPVKVNLTFFDVDMIGTSRIKVNSANIDWDNYFIEVDASLENGPATLLADYTVDGKVLVLPIQGKGKSNITLDNLGVLLTVKGSELIKNNKKYFKVDTCDFVIRSSRVHIYFGNLFDGVPNLGENMNTFLNDNWKEIINELNSTISGAMGLGIKEVTNNFFQKVPVNQLYT